MENEKWIIIEDAPNYSISDFGYVKNNKTGKILKGVLNSEGYFCLTLRHNNQSLQKAIHRLVGIYHIPNPLNLPEINHKKGIKTDNRAIALEWCTKPQNLQHALDSGLRLTPEQHADKEFNALKEAHKARYSVSDRKNGEVKGFPKEFIKSIYDTNDNVLFGSSYVKGKVHYDYMDGYYTKDGIPFIISVGIKYDGKGNSDLPEDAIKMPFSQLPHMFPNNIFS